MSIKSSRVGGEGLVAPRSGFFSSCAAESFISKSGCSPPGLLTGKTMGHAYLRGNTRLPLRLQDSTLAQACSRTGKLLRIKLAESFEIYNIVDDIGAAKNLAGKHPAKVNELKTIMLHAKCPAENPEFNWSDTEK